MRVCEHFHYIYLKLNVTEQFNTEQAEQDDVCVSGWVCCVSCSDRGQGLARIQDQDPDPGDAGTWSEPRVDTESPLLASTWW